MSGRGNPPQGAPARILVSLRTAEPFVDGSGRLLMWAAQFLQRLVDLVGPPPPGNSGDTITTIIGSLMEGEGMAIGTQGPDGATQARLLALEQAAAWLPPPAPPPPLPGLLPPLWREPIPPLMPLMPWATGTGGGCDCPVYAPLVNGDLPGPVAIADGLGQFIMVPIT